MTSYLKAAFTSVLISWLFATVIYELSMLVVYGRFDFLTEFIFIAFYTLIFSLAANFLFNQLPKHYIKKLFFSLSRFQFALFQSVYGLIIFTILIGYYYLDSNRLLFFNAAANGFIYGLAFHSIWKPKTMENS